METPPAGAPTPCSASPPPSPRPLHQAQALALAAIHRPSRTADSVELPPDPRLHHTPAEEFPALQVLTFSAAPPDKTEPRQRWRTSSSCRRRRPNVNSFHARHQIRHHQRRCCKCWPILLLVVVESAADGVRRCYPPRLEMLFFLLQLLCSVAKMLYVYCYELSSEVTIDVSDEVFVMWICNLGILFATTILWFCYNYIICLLRGLR